MRNNMRTAGVSIMSIIFIIIIMIALVNIATNDEDKPSSNKVKTTQTNKWTDMLEFALLKNKANVGVGCKEKKIAQKTYILCEYSLFKLFGKRNFALLMREGDKLYAINGTSKNLLKYDEIVEYDVNIQGRVDIVGIKNQF